MRIGVISDTHVKSLSEIPDPILKCLAEVDLIIHAGDFTERAVLEGLKKLGEVKAVWGNMDSSELRAMLPQKELFVINGKKIGLTHGSGGPQGMEERVKRMFKNIDVIIYGHSHEAHRQIIGESLLFNPGHARKSFGLLRIGDEIEAEIIRLG